MELESLPEEQGLKKETVLAHNVAPARYNAFKILGKINQGVSLDESLNHTNINILTENDKRLVYELVHGVLRNRGKLDWLISKFAKGGFSSIAPPILEILRLSLYQILFLERIPSFASVNDGVNLTKGVLGNKQGSFVNAILREIIRQKDSLPSPKPDDDIAAYLSVTYSHPKWLISRWLDRFGKNDITKLLEWNNQIPPLEVLVDPLAVTCDKFANDCIEKKITATKNRIIENSFLLDTITNIKEIPGFQEGWFLVQGSSAQIPAIILDPKPGERVLDLCAAPGGKSVQMAWIMKNRGQIIAVESQKDRMAKLLENINRCNATIIEPVVLDARRLTPETYGLFDKVLVDAPCSGTGVLRKKIETRWQKKEKDIKRHAQLQKELMRAATKLLKPGGVLVYSTCSLEPEENIDIISSVLRSHSEITATPSEENIAHQFKEFIAATPFPHWQVLPQHHNMDGFFIARLHREAH